MNRDLLIGVIPTLVTLERKRAKFVANPTDAKELTPAEEKRRAAMLVVVVPRRERVLCFCDHVDHVSVVMN